MGGEGRGNTSPPIIVITIIIIGKMFRVTAYNAAGESETSETSTAIEVTITSSFLWWFWFQFCFLTPTRVIIIVLKSWSWSGDGSFCEATTGQGAAWEGERPHRGPDDEAGSGTVHQTNHEIIKTILIQNNDRSPPKVVEAQPPAKFQWFRPNGEPVLHDNEKILIDNEKNK